MESPALFIPHQMQMLGIEKRHTFPHLPVRKTPAGGRKAKAAPPHYPTFKVCQVAKVGEQQQHSVYPGRGEEEKPAKRYV